MKEHSYGCSFLLEAYTPRILIRYICIMRLTVVFAFFFALGSASISYAQETETDKDSLKVVDTNYREDQFYASLTYNLLANKPNGLSQSGFSSGYHLGFIRDMPVNERRNVAIGIGLGLSSNSYNQTMLITESNSQYSYTLLNDNEIDFDKNKFTTYLVEMPFEFRWRTSTATEYDFWRVYAGFKLAYMVFNSSKFEGQSGTIKLYDIQDFNRFQYGLTLSAGYSTISFQVYYGLNNLFKDSAQINNEPIEVTAVKMGLIFYIL